MTEKTKEPSLPTRIFAVYFDRSIVFGTDTESASVWSPDGKTSAPSNSVDSIEPCWLRHDGFALTGEMPVCATRPPDGLLLRKKVSDLQNGRKYIRQSFVPMGNLRSVTYGE